MKKVIVLVMESQYPFRSKERNNFEQQTILVRQTIRIPRGQKNNVLAKTNFVKNLKNKYLVKVDSVYEEEGNFYLMYEYISISLRSALEMASCEEFYQIQQQLHNFCTYLANIGIKVLLTFNRLGLSNNNMVKYFLGLDFEWVHEPEEDFLERYYQSQVEELLSPYYPETSTNYQTSDAMKSNQNDKKRKVSFATLPSRFNRYKNIDKKLNSIKAYSRDKKTEQNIRSYSNAETVPRQLTPGNAKGSLTRKTSKRIEDRKYSGDIQTGFFSKNRLEEKQSDIKSQFGHKNKNRSRETPRRRDESNHSEVGTNKSSSRIEEMKSKEYKDIANSNKSYLKDFLSVLEEDEDIPNTPKHVTGNESLFNETKFFTGSETSIIVGSDASDLQIKVQQAIKNSLKVMQKFKSFLH